MSIKKGAATGPQRKAKGEEQSAATPVTRNDDRERARRAYAAVVGRCADECMKLQDALEGLPEADALIAPEEVALQGFHELESKLVTVRIGFDQAVDKVH